MLIPVLSLSLKVLRRIDSSFSVIDSARQILINEMIASWVFGANDGIRTTGAGLLPCRVYALLCEVLGLSSPVFGRQALFLNLVLLH